MPSLSSSSEVCAAVFKSAEGPADAEDRLASFVTGFVPRGLKMGRQKGAMFQVTPNWWFGVVSWGFELLVLVAKQNQLDQHDGKASILGFRVDNSQGSRYSPFGSFQASPSKVHGGNAASPVFKKAWQRAQHKDTRQGPQT